MTGWIVYNGNLATEKFIDYVHWFQEAAAKKNIHIEAKVNNELLVLIENGEPQLIVNGEKIGKNTPLPHFIHFHDKDIHLARHLETLGIRLFNPANAIALCDNKAWMHQALATSNIPMPKTIIAPKIYEGLPMTNSGHLDLVIQHLGLPLIIKEAYGSFGQQVYWIDTKEELVEKVSKLTGKEFIFQAPVMTSLGTDLRLNVVGDKVVAAMKRSSSTDFRANVTAGGKTLPYTPTEEEEQLAIASAKAVGADFAGVDLLKGENGPILCEINSNPHIRSIYECTGVNVADHMIDHIVTSLPSMKERR